MAKIGTKIIGNPMITQDVNAVLGAGKSAVGSVGSALASAGGGIGGIFKTALGLIPHFAFGGPISSGMTALVGENGPEIVKSGSAGTVISNDNIGYGDVHNHTHNHAYDLTKASDPRENERRFQKSLMAHHNSAAKTGMAGTRGADDAAAEDGGGLTVISFEDRRQGEGFTYRFTPLLLCLTFLVHAGISRASVIPKWKGLAGEQGAGIVTLQLHTEPSEMLPSENILVICPSPEVNKKSSCLYSLKGGYRQNKIVGSDRTSWGNVSYRGIPRLSFVPCVTKFEVARHLRLVDCHTRVLSKFYGRRNPVILPSKVGLITYKLMTRGIDDVRFDYFARTNESSLNRDESVVRSKSQKMSVLCTLTTLHFFQSGGSSVCGGFSSLRGNFRRVRLSSRVVGVIARYENQEHSTSGFYPFWSVLLEGLPRYAQFNHELGIVFAFAFSAVAVIAFASFSCCSSFVGFFVRSILVVASVAACWHLLWSYLSVS